MNWSVGHNFYLNITYMPNTPNNHFKPIYARISVCTKK